MRAWIETGLTLICSLNSSVALRVRAWIETNCFYRQINVIGVALRVRAWIETFMYVSRFLRYSCRPPREGVD